MDFLCEPSVIFMLYAVTMLSDQQMPDESLMCSVCGFRYTLPQTLQCECAIKVDGLCLYVLLPSPLF